jgi:hypothetical protein
MCPPRARLNVSTRVRRKNRCLRALTLLASSPAYYLCFQSECPWSADCCVCLLGGSGSVDTRGLAWVFIFA